MPILQEYDLHGKVAVVAGYGDIFTPELAEALAEAGSYVFLIAGSQAMIDEAEPRVRKHKEEVAGLVCDFTDESAVEAAVEAAAARWGRVDILVNNFRTEFGKPLLDVKASEFDEVMARNVTSVFLMCRAVGAVMLERGGGRIINIISGLAERGLWNSAPFCASQGAVLQLTRALALEWGRGNIRVNAIGTGWYTTEDLPPEEAQKELLVRYIPLRRKGHPRDIGPLLVYLSSDACEYTTGQPIYVDGGLMAHP